jgi:hypothetical protein
VDLHPITIVDGDDRRRSRLTVLFRALLVIPHMIWLALWGFAAFMVAIVAWVFALATGAVPPGMHGFIASWLRYSTRVNAYYYLLANPFPPFTDAGAYAVDLEVAPPQPQNRLVTLGRWILVIPAAIVAYVYGIVLGVLAFVAWLVGIFTARMPDELGRFGVYLLGYQQQTVAYALLLTERYPSLSSENVVAERLPVQREERAAF